VRCCPGLWRVGDRRGCDRPDAGWRIGFIHCSASRTRWARAHPGLLPAASRLEALMQAQASWLQSPQPAFGWRAVPGPRGFLAAGSLRCACAPSPALQHARLMPWASHIRRAAPKATAPHVCLHNGSCQHGSTRAMPPVSRPALCAALLLPKLCVCVCVCPCEARRHAAHGYVLCA
jgi:hypothetical protein